MGISTSPSDPLPFIGSRGTRCVSFLADCIDDINGCMPDPSARRAFKRELLAKLFEHVDRVHISTTFTLQCHRKVSTQSVHC